MAFTNKRQNFFHAGRSRDYDVGRLTRSKEKEISKGLALIETPHFRMTKICKQPCTLTASYLSTRLSTKTLDILDRD